MRYFFILSFFLSSNLFADVDVNGAKDLDQLERFPRSYIVQYEQVNDVDYRLILGGLEKINGVLAPEKEDRLNGLLTRVTYRIPDNHSPDEAFHYIHQQLVALGGNTLFQCAGRECGSSNQWANSILEYSRLYGIDNTQNFAAVKLGKSYFSIYSVRRGNKRVYLRVDQLESSALDLLSALQSGVMTEISLQDDQLQQIAEYIEVNPNKRVWILTYDNAEGDKHSQLERAKQSGARVKGALVEAGVSESNIMIHALGGFVSSVFSGTSGISILSEDL